MLTETLRAERYPAGYQQLTVSSTAVALTVPTGASRAKISVVSNPIRYRDDGTDPTSSVGFNVPTNTIFELYSRESLLAFKAIATGSNATLDIIYYKS